MTRHALQADVGADSDKGRYSPTVISGTLVAAVGSGDEAFNSGISVNENQRTNLGVFNFSDTASSIQARILDQFGTVTQTIRFEIRPYSWSQKSTGAAINNGIIRWELPTGDTESSDGRVYLWVVMVDNRSNDGTLTSGHRRIWSAEASGQAQGPLKYAITSTIIVVGCFDH